MVAWFLVSNIINVHLINSTFISVYKLNVDIWMQYILYLSELRMLEYYEECYFICLFWKPFTFIFFCPEGETETVNKLEIKRGGQRKQSKDHFSVHCEVGHGIEKKSRMASCAFRLGQTGILIRAAEYHCFIRRGSEHTHSHDFGRMHKLYTQTRGQGRCACWYMCNDPGHLLYVE